MKNVLPFAYKLDLEKYIEQKKDLWLEVRLMLGLW